MTPEQVVADSSLVYGQLFAEDRDLIARLEGERISPGDRFEAEIRYRLPSGAIKWSHISSETMIRDDGTYVWDGVEVDITDRKEAELELARHRDELEALVSERTVELEHTNAELVEASRAKSTFLANMSHEFRTPLNSIIGFSDVLLHGLAGTMSDRQHDQIELIHRSGMHLLALINDILDLSKIESGRVALKVSMFSTVDLVRAGSMPRCSAVPCVCSELDQGSTFTLEVPVPDAESGGTSLNRVLKARCARRPVRVPSCIHVSRRLLRCGRTARRAGLER